MDTSSGDHAADLSFDKATYAHDSSAGAPCANCSGPLGEQYWSWQARSVCAKCRAQISEMLERSQSNRSFFRAAWLGGLVALGCGIAYAIFVALTKFQLALATIGIAYLIAKVMRRCSGGVGGRKYQVLAVALTYAASAMGYGPGIWDELRDGSKETASAPAPTSGAEQAASKPAPAAQKREAPSDQQGEAGAFLFAVALLFGITLAAPILAATQAPIGLLIVGFGLWEAWKLSRGLPLTLDGPYRASPAATGSPAA